MRRIPLERWLVLPGVPAGSGAWERLKTPLDVHAFRGLETLEDRVSWRLQSFVEEIDEQVDSKTGLIGQDLGGVIAAMLCARRLEQGRPPPLLVLTGTALGRWWTFTRWSALPGVQRFFYRRYGGRRFLSSGVHTESKETILQRFEPLLDATPDFPDRMRALAREMKPPRQLAHSIRSVPTALLWGRDDPWYPTRTARRLARQLDAPLKLLPGRHYPMWESPSAFDAALAEISTLATAQTGR